MEILTIKSISILLEPLGIALIILLVAVVVAWRRPLSGWKPVLLAFIVLYPLSMQYVADQFL